MPIIKIILPLLLLTLINFPFYSQPTFAATVPYMITSGIPPTSIPWSQWGQTFYETSFDVNYTSGQVLLSSGPEGAGNTIVDDGFNISITVANENGSEQMYFRYDHGCSGLRWEPPMDVTRLFKSGTNQVYIKLFDTCGWAIGSSPLYLVNLNAPEPQTAKTPLIFIPGIGGSEFKIKNAVNWSADNGHGGIFNYLYPAGEKVWVNEIMGAMPGDDDYFDILRLKPDGQTAEADLELTGNIFAGAYQPTIDFFTQNGYTLDKDLFVFPYDWRKDLALTAPLLNEKISQIKQANGHDKVDIVAHSMGGLVARNYIADAERAQHVRKLIELGVPHLGATKFLKALNSGDCLLLELGPFCLSIAPSEIRDVLQNMPGGFELSPTKKYFDFYSGEDNLHPYPFNDLRDIDNNGIFGPLTYDQIKVLLTNLGHNTSLFTPTEIFHNIDDNLYGTNGVDISIIAGSGIGTVGQIVEKYLFNFGGIKIPSKDLIKINGDETVPLFSASLSDPYKNLSLIGPAKVYYTQQKHGALSSAGPALYLTKNILESNNDLPAGVATEPYKLKGVEASVHSPVNLHAYDQASNHTGPLPNGDFETNIPGSSYETLDDAKFIWLPEDGVYTFKFEATDQGSFDFKIRSYDDDQIQKTILYKNIRLTTTTKGETTFDTTSTTPPIINIDEDGNGITDKQIDATSALKGNAGYDQTPPKTEIKLEGIQGNNNWFTTDVTVTLVDEDNTEGSGIYKTEYSLDNGQTINIYNQPITISTEGTTKLKFRSVDNAGNEETPQETEIKIDKTSPTVNLSVNPNILWPPNKKMINVTIAGSTSDNISGVKSKTFSFEDEYKTVVSALTDFNQILQLEAWRKGEDKDGRIYKISVLAEDQAGNQATASAQIVVPHDQRK